MHIGLIGGIGPAATEFYYRSLVRTPMPAAAPLELTIAHADMGALLRNLGAGAPELQAKLFCHHVSQLAAAGAEVAAVTSIAGHFCIRELEAVSPLPLVNALTALAQELRGRGLQRVGLLGSQIAMETRLYGAVSGLEVVMPLGDDLVRVGNEYIAMAGAQRATDAQREMFFSVGAGLCSGQGAEVVLLAGTDMFLAFEEKDPGFAVIDSAEVHIDELSRIARLTKIP